MSIVRYHPVTDEEKNTNAYKELNVKIKQKHFSLWEKADKYLALINEKGMDFLTSEIKQNKGKFKITGNIYEMRIPPKSKRGVIRIYFTFSDDGSHIIVLGAEYKNETKAKQIKNAQKIKRNMK